ncbi:hypothetical protein AKJ37_02165 [candidate division MSBL1 archaeon SCGC-AAA259I09]|uniref:PAC domain-containing protein n=1 Tax=candidate division MSBL1 archaeon SCGC-AAA259I09 TaxID=1698267 RepID=A0A133UUG8_9EURY|nr:hypothetical protein AKJ37_02165 [candidate division MSBL1 archaeon SCGC-AAA259I09]
MKGVPLYDERDQFAGRVVVLRDITERKEAEERKEFLNTLLRQDLGGKYRTMQGYLQLLEDADLPEEQGKHLRKALKAGREAEIPPVPPLPVPPAPVPRSPLCRFCPLLGISSPPHPNLRTHAFPATCASSRRNHRNTHMCTGGEFLFHNSRRSAIAISPPSFSFRG